MYIYGRFVFTGFKVVRDSMKYRKFIHSFANIFESLRPDFSADRIL